MFKVLLLDCLLMSQVGKIYREEEGECIPRLKSLSQRFRQKVNDPCSAPLLDSKNLKRTTSVFQEIVQLPEWYMKKTFDISPF